MRRDEGYYSCPLHKLHAILKVTDKLAKSGK